MVELKDFSLNFVKTFFWYTFHRANSNAIIFLNTNDDVTSSKIINVISECADAMVDGRRIPSFLKFYPVRFYSLLSKQIFYIYR